LVVANKGDKGMWLAKNSYSEFLHPVDAELSVFLLNAMETTNIQVAEIGVWKGAWIATILKNNVRSRAIGIDPYPNSLNVKKVMEARLGSLGISERFAHFSKFDSIPAGVYFDVIHVDGLHTEDQVLTDLQNSQSRLQESGVIILDDFRHAWFPGIQSALFQFLLSENYKIFMVSANKAYLARPKRAKELWHYFRINRASLKIGQLHEYWTEFAAKANYVQESNVLGQSVLIASSVPSLRLVCRFIHKVPRYVKLLLP
jgi:hypothetical protein